MKHEQTPAVLQGFTVIVYGTIKIGDRVQINGEWVPVSAKDIRRHVSAYQKVIRKVVAE